METSLSSAVTALILEGEFEDHAADGVTPEGGIEESHYSDEELRQIIRKHQQMLQGD